MEIREVKRLDNGDPFVIETRSEDNDISIRMKWDGCIDIRKYFNGSSPENPSDGNSDYIHICEVKEFIKELQSIVSIAEQNFTKHDFENYWSKI